MGPNDEGIDGGNVGTEQKQIQQRQQDQRQIGHRVGESDWGKMEAFLFEKREEEC
jgi:hypothetical protein